MAPLRNVKHESFCQLVIKGTAQGLSQAQIYRMAGYQAEGHTAEVNASRLLKNAEIQARIGELAAPPATVRRVRATAADLLEKSERVFTRAFEIDEMGHANKAVELQGKLGGALIDRVEIGGVGEFGDCQTPEQVLDKLIETTDGGASVLIAELEQMIRDVEARAGDNARVISPR